ALAGGGSRPARAADAAPVSLAADAAPVSLAADPRLASALSSGELRESIARLRVTGSVLYVGAHPDDDNTSLLAALARGRRVRTTYLSLTRGDGGQNILGTETGEALGVLRTQELLASRRVDGAEQLFGRARDFGFSKSPDEALRVWGHDRTLADMVWLIRCDQPDIIITRFGTDGSGGHGHHTASALLAGEAFRAAADSTRFPEQLAFVPVWRARRLLWNTWAPKLEGRDPHSPKLLTLDAGIYDPDLGASYAELGGRARSLNRSQGAGTPERRGRLTEYFEQVDGEFAEHDLFEDVPPGWSRIAGAGALDSLLAAAEREFDPAQPALVLPLLARAHAAMLPLIRSSGANAPRVRAKLAELERVMRWAAGLWLEANAETPSVCPGDTVLVSLTAIDRGGAPIRVARIELPFGAHGYYRRESPPGTAAGAQSAMLDSAAATDHTARELPANQPVVAQARMVVPRDAPFSQPYWLRGSIDPAAAQEPAGRWRGEPERLSAPPAL
ncbi:MAG: PIG-L family deacetylase, partial [Candidatus Eiseniibacteriota bacterium]